MKLLLATLILSSLVCALAQTDVEELYDDSNKEIVIEEITEDKVKQTILVDRTYNSSFTISIPMLSVVVPGTNRANGVVRFTMSHVTMWALVGTGFVGLVYPIILGPHGRLHKRSIDEPRTQPYLLDHLKSIVNAPQILEDVLSLLPEGMSNVCLERALCEAREQENALGFGGRLFRYAYSGETFDDFEDGENDIVDDSPTPTQTCADLYPKCVISPAEVYREASEAFTGSLSSW